MNFIKGVRSCFVPTLCIVFIIFFRFTEVCAQQQPQKDIHQQHTTGVFLLNITPKAGGKSYTLFHKTKVGIMMNDGHEVSGKVIGVGRDSISVAYHSLAIKDISEIVFKPGSTLGVIAAIATTVGLATIALTIDKQQDAILFSGIGLAAAGGIVLIPTYFIKKHFNSGEYDFTAVMIGSL